MTTPVATNGFVEPPVPNGTPINIPPPAAPVAPAEPAAATPAAAPAGFETALAALTEALKGAQAPAAPAAAAAEPAVQSELASYDVSSIEDPIIKSMATIMQTVGKGLDMDRALGKAIADGRADLIDVAYLREKGGANADDLIAIANGLVNAVAAKSAAVTSEVHKLAGGEEQWDAGVAVFNKSAPQELRMVVAQMLDSGKDNMIQAGAKLIVEFSKGSGYLPNVTPGVNSGAASMPAAQALDKFEFQAELRKLNPQDRNFNEQRADLFARRSLGRSLGK